LKKPKWNGVVASNVRLNGNAAVASTVLTLTDDGNKTPVLAELHVLFYQPTELPKFATETRKQEPSSGLSSMVCTPRILSGGIA
jgi:hypothetical protein